MVRKSDPPAYKPGGYQELLPHAGAFNYLKENFSNAPSLDMSTASLNMLVRLMVAQVQECVFEKMTLLRSQHNFLARLQLAQEAARVSTSGRRGLGGAVTTGEAPSVVGRTPQERTACCHCLLMDVLHLNPWLSSLSLDAPQVEDVYLLVHQTMTQAHVKDYVPFSWTTMVHVKSEHFKALSHYFAAIALCDCPGECYSSEAAACTAKCRLHVVAWCLGGIAKKEVKGDMYRVDGYKT